MVREATSNDPWGASSNLMQRIAREADFPANYHAMMEILWKRISDYQHIKHVVKSLNLVQYLLLHASQRFVDDMRSRKDVIRRLKGYKYIKEGRDIGQEVRNNASYVYELINDEDRLERARATARNVRGKIIGFAHDTSYKSEFSPHLRGSDSLQSSFRHENNAFEEKEETSIKKHIEKKKRTKKKREPEPEIQVTGSDSDSISVQDIAVHATKNGTDIFDLSLYENGMEDFSVPISNVNNNVFIAERDFGTDEDAFEIEKDYADDDPALFDHMAITQTQTDIFLDNNKSSTADKVQDDFEEFEQEADVWDAGKYIINISDITVSSDEVKRTSALIERKERERSAPKLKDMQVQREEDPFDATLRGAITRPTSSMHYDHSSNSMALVSLQQSWNVPLMPPPQVFDYGNPGYYAQSQYYNQMIPQYHAPMPSQHQQQPYFGELRWN